METIYDDLWFCTDCTFLAVNGDAPDDEKTAARCIAGLERLSEKGTVVPNDGEDGDGRDEFSTRRCDCCHSRLGGSRHRFAVLGEVQK